MMIRTQIYLPKELTEEVTRIAQRKGKAKAEVIREALEKGLEQQQPTETVGQALQKLVDLGHEYTPKSGPTDLSINHDKYLYEEKDL